ncbi:MAG: chromosome segregation protein SMC [Acidobacteria bacterium]|nr:MAG: chromosome segregation protein SMC [Acidobacteriota bacterium]
MLKLKKLQILGFKSFCDRTELKFPGDGIAAIVGPNGCGKSNISDAISWVLGEQSAKSLRGAQMADVIFAGTRERKPTGMAEVTLHLIDPQVYEGTIDAPIIEIQDEMPDQDWDEAALRAQNEREVEEYTEEVRPGQTDEIEVASPTTAATAGSGSAPVNDGAPSMPPEVSGDPGEQATVNTPQVVLKIRRRKFKTTFKKGEIAITRRLFRTGDSEYLLNGKLCRLRDIQDIFMGTGLGPESYALIEQGRIGQILSSKPTDRRNIIEEAAGITKFKTRKRLAEARLADAKQNLARINDIFDEVTRQMNSLKRQAAKAERYAKLRDEMREQLRIVLASRFTELETQARQLDGELTRLTEDLHIRTEAVQAMDSEYAERTRHGYTIDSEAKQTREHLSQLSLEMERATARRRNNEERCAELTARAAAAEAEASSARGQSQRLQDELSANQQVLESAAAEVASAQQERNQRQSESQQAAQRLMEVERNQEHQRRQMLDSVNAASTVRNRITQAEERIAALRREAERLQHELNSANQQVESFGGQRGQLSLEFESATELSRSIAARIAEARAQVAEKRAAEVEAKKHLDSMRSEAAKLQGKCTSLEAVIKEHGFSTESVRRLLRSGQLTGASAPVGVLADFIEVEDEYEGVVDEFLRDELNFLVVKSWDAANEGLNLLRSAVEGRATFLVHPDDSQAKFSFVVDEATRAHLREDRVIPLKDCIRVPDTFGSSLEVILPKLGNGYIVPDAETGRALALENPDAFYLALSGECFHNVTVTGGKKVAEGPLQMKRELREVQRQVEELARRLASQENTVAQLGSEIHALTSLLDRLEAERRDSEQKVMASGHSLRQLESEMTRVRDRIAGYERELQRVAGERQSREAFIAERQQELDQHEEKRLQLEAQMSESQEHVAELRLARDAAAQAASEVMARVAGLEERRRAAASSLARIQSMVAEVNHRVNSLQSQLEGAAAEKLQREQENELLASKEVEWQIELEKAQAREQQLATESEQIRARLSELELELKAGREVLDSVRDRRGELSAQSAKIASNTEHLVETCIQELSQSREELLLDEALVRQTGNELAATEAGYREMRTRLEGMGPVNMMALEEYKETSQRHEFLETQRKDLLDSIENTQSTIKEIEEISREKFNDAFAIINENFTRTFKKLFGGGDAWMKLTDEENSAESGIDIVASPPGKKMQNVLLLSGGEKTLTALSLLVGIFQFAPAPFCILDEVDAPLDEANVTRFGELMREMSMETQFIVITHHKKTMSMAPVLYGVTMQEPGVSRIVSVRFGAEQVQPQAATA